MCKIIKKEKDLKFFFLFNNKIFNYGSLGATGIGIIGLGSGIGIAGAAGAGIGIIGLGSGIGALGASGVLADSSFFDSVLASEGLVISAFLVQAHQSQPVKAIKKDKEEIRTIFL
jgi:hypothetical protein